MLPLHQSGPRAWKSLVHSSRDNLVCHVVTASCDLALQTPHHRVCAVISPLRLGSAQLNVLPSGALSSGVIERLDIGHPSRRHNSTDHSGRTGARMDHKLRTACLDRGCSGRASCWGHVPIPAMRMTETRHGSIQPKCSTGARGWINHPDIPREVRTP